MTDAIEGVFQKVKALEYESADDFIFVRKDGARCTGHDISCAVDRRASEAGIKKTSIHGIRRTVSSMLNTILPQKAVVDMLGHTERVNEQFYNYSMAENAEKKRAGVNLLGKFDEKVYSAFSLLFSLIIYTKNITGLAAD